LDGEVGEELDEAAFGFAYQDDAVGEQAVADAVAGGVSLALSGDGSF
jgi:hypothetical protein